MDLPLESKYIVSQREGHIPTLDQRWKCDMRFISYSPPPLNHEDRASVEEWLELCSFIEDDLDTLLRMPHDKFWCQVVFDDSLQICVDSYLKLAPRSRDLVHNVAQQVKEKQEKLHRLFFFTCLRMATHKESKEHFITPSVFGEIMYENFIFDIPKLMDLCALYSDNNAPLLSKMITNIFTQQPKYLDDLTATVPTIIHVLVNVLQKCGLNVGTGTGSPQRLDPSVKKNKLVTMTDAEFNDVLMYVCDMAHTVHSFFDSYPAAAKIFMSHEFPTHLVTFYEAMVAAVKEAFQIRQWEYLEDKSRLKHSWFRAQVSMVNSLRQIVLQNCLNPLLEATSEDEAADLIETYFDLITAVLGERRFIAVYERLFPFCDDRDLIAQSKYPVDEARWQFIGDGINEAVALYGHGSTRQRAESPEEAGATHFPPQQNFLSEAELIAASRDPRIPDTDEVGACAPKMSGVKLDSFITSVKDLLPDLGEGFIELCLEELDYNIEQVINAVLEDNLPSSLQDMDKTMKRDKAKMKPEEPALIEQRANVYDNDEFDMFRRDNIDKSRIHKGKKTKVTAKDLDDKELIKTLKPLYEKYNLEFTESAYDNDRNYDDEYDDTYDTNLVGADDAGSADELTHRRPFTVPRILGARDSPRLTENTSDSEEDERNKRRDFVENPADIRARREERQAYNAGQRGPGPRHDVKGREKGQGQEKDVLKNRAYKEKHKNKNRRHLADKKRQT